MSSTIITPAQARKELARRAAASGTAKRRNYPATHIFQASKAELHAALAVVPAPKPVPVVVPVPEPVKLIDPHVNLRKRAWAMHQASQGTANPITYKAACAKLHTFRAKDAA